MRIYIIFNDKFPILGHQNSIEYHKTNKWIQQPETSPHLATQICTAYSLLDKPTT